MIIIPLVSYYGIINQLVAKYLMVNCYLVVSHSSAINSSVVN